MVVLIDDLPRDEAWRELGGREVRGVACWSGLWGGFKTGGIDLDKERSYLYYRGNGWS